MKQLHKFKSIQMFQGDSLGLYQHWESPVVIISDGAYGVNGFPGDCSTPDDLSLWYEPHIKQWSNYATPVTTLWFWNTEIGWANVHPILAKYGWKYVSCCIWDKGLSHVAGNANTKTLRHLPIVTEVCVQYVKTPKFLINDTELSMKEWLWHEWKRTGLPFSKTNEACGVKNAATRKYFTKCHLWYMPPSDAFERIVNYANEYGDVTGRPYFSINGKTPMTKNQWDVMRAKFHCPFSVTNVWKVNQLRNEERIKEKNKAIHLNQKPLSLIKNIIEMSSDRDDVIWDPFGGLFTTAIASLEVGRKCFCAESNENIFSSAVNRFKHSCQNSMQSLLQF